MEVIIFSNDCPKCRVLKSKMNSKGISFIESNNFEEITNAGFSFLPVLKVNGEYMDFIQANAWVNAR